MRFKFKRQRSEGGMFKKTEIALRNVTRYNREPYFVKLFVIRAACYKLVIKYRFLRGKRNIISNLQLQAFINFFLFNAGNLYLQRIPLLFRKRYPRKSKTVLFPHASQNVPHLIIL